MQFWRDNGFLVLRAAINPENIQSVLDVVNAQWRDRERNDHQIDVNSGPDAGKIFRLSEAALRHRKEIYKLNNLFLRVPAIRKVAYSPVLKAALIDLLEGEPLVCNSLNFERGSQQSLHFDTWYMPPPVEGRMVAANIALEGVDAENGPIFYYPGSHLMQPWRFSDGGLQYRHDEAGAMLDYVNSEIAERGLRAESFGGSAGDVFLWHAYLYHGGSPIRDMKRTRRSLVVHYWRAMDVDPRSVLRDETGAFLNRTLRGEITLGA